MNTASIKTATVSTNMVVFVRLLRHNHTEEKTGAYAAQRADNMSAAWKPLGGERKIKKGIQPWHTCSDTSAFQREKKQPCGLRNTPSFGCIEGNAEAAGDACEGYDAK